VAHEFVGAGWAFPLRIDPTGAFELVTDEREIEQAIRLILSTSYGERPMRPDFGCRIHEFVYAEANATMAGRISTEVRASLARWEPRITVDDILVSGDPTDQTLLYVDIRYHIGDRNDPRNLVFPFYTIPPER